ncbi:MAG: transposase [Bacteroidia bacterium]|nr:MAG: transposase [Bacteroidia bacterium]
MLKAYKYYIKPDIDQQKLLQNNFDAARAIYNRSLALKSYAFKKFGIQLGLKELKGRLPKLRKRHQWLKDAYSAVLQQSVINLDNAFKRFFKKQTKYPCFKSKRDRQSIQYPANVTVDVHNKTIHLPKIGDINLVLHRELGNGKIKTVTISKTTSGKYFASILIDDGEAPVTKLTVINEDKVIGIDAGITNIIHSSNNTSIANPKYLKKYQRKLAKAQKSLARKTNKASKRRAKKKQEISKIHEKITNTRNDFQHKLSASLVDENQAIGVETLMIKNLMKNRKLSKSFADASISSLYTKIQYKIEQKGGHLIKIDKWYPSTKRCSNCNAIKEKIQLNERTYNCNTCGVSLSRDYNAALNIKREAINILRATGHVVLRRGDTGRPQFIVAGADEASRSLTL